MGNWYIDSLDVRAGLCFASQHGMIRKNDGLDGISAFIRPPYFTPEIVDGRTAGFALGRGRGQIGLFVEDSDDVLDVAFPSLEAVSEFVRRCYLSGSGGIEPGDDGAPILPRPDDPPDMPYENLEFEKGTDPIRNLISFAASSERIIKKLDRFDTASLKKTLQKNDSLAENVPERLSRAALTILFEFSVRAPHSSPWKFEQAFIQFVVCLARMGIVDTLERSLDQHPDPAAFAVQFENSDFRSFREMLEYFRHIAYRVSFNFAGLSTDPYRSLAYLPVPAGCSGNGARKGSIENLRGLLTAAISSPHSYFVDKKSATAQFTTELVYFAAFYLNTSSVHSIAAFEASRYSGYWRDQTGRVANWLQNNLPQMLFSSEVEHHIRQAFDTSIGGPSPRPRPKGALAV